jgi:hypothetical protein
MEAGALQVYVMGYPSFSPTLPDIWSFLTYFEAGKAHQESIRTSSRYKAVLGIACAVFSFQPPQLRFSYVVFSSFSAP